METQIKTSGGAKDFFLNLGAIVVLYTLVVSLLNLLFNIINTIYPKITNGYDYSSSASISWPVAVLIIFFPIFIFLMWLLGKEYTAEPERKNLGIHKILTYITLFVAGLTMAIDLIVVLYYFLDGQEITTGFLLKVLMVIIVAASVFIYYISDLRDRLTMKSRMFWRVFAGVFILGSIIWGFAVIGSPATQRLIKYDEQKITDLQNINNQIINYYSTKGSLPANLTDTANGNYYIPQVDPQNQKPYEYIKTGNTTYNLCADFNKASNDNNNIARPVGSFGDQSWIHPAGRYCFQETVNLNMFPYPKAIPVVN
jgi:hypothetical protein